MTKKEIIEEIVEQVEVYFDRSVNLCFAGYKRFKKDELLERLELARKAAEFAIKAREIKASWVAKTSEESWNVCILFPKTNPEMAKAQMVHSEISRLANDYWLMV